MKLIKLLAVIAALAIANAIYADTAITVTSNFNAGISLSPNGPLDAAPIWTSVGPNTMTVVNALNATINCTTVGTNVVTITATSKGNPLSAIVTVVVTAPPAPVPPATTLGAQAYQMTK